MSSSPQAASALAEITPLKTQYEIAVNEGKTPSLTATDAGYVGQTENGGSYCALSLVTNGIKCTGKNGNASKFDGKSITLTRDTEGMWTCTSDLATKYQPGQCGAAATP